MLLIIILIIIIILNLTVLLNNVFLYFKCITKNKVNSLSAKSE